eukprot:3434957-Rhodomonas_salina.2
MPSLAVFLPALPSAAQSKRCCFNSRAGERQVVPCEEMARKPDECIGRHQASRRSMETNLTASVSRPSSPQSVHTPAENGKPDHPPAAPPQSQPPKVFSRSATAS